MAQDKEQGNSLRRQLGQKGKKRGSSSCVLFDAIGCGNNGTRCLHHKSSPRIRNSER